MAKFEHKVGDRVGIIRARHGWYDGSVHGNVTEVNHRSGGAAYYTVKDYNAERKSYTKSMFEQHNKPQKKTPYPKYRS